MSLIFLLGSNAIPGSEDSLTINVQRPASTKATAKSLVLLWIYGGGFETGSTLGYDGAGTIMQSLEMNQPILFVAVNYRTNAFGFL